MEKAKDSVDEYSLADLNDLNDLKETINELASNEIQHPISKENIDQEDDINKVSPEIIVSSDLSRNPGFEHMKISSSKCSTYFARYRKKDIKGVSLIEELSKIIEVGDSFAFDVRGDMNVVRNDNKRSGSLFSRQDADNFNSFIENSGLIDLPLGGRLFTWMKKPRTKLSKLDRFLISDEVAQALPDVRVTAIDRLWSDHNLILLYVSKSNFGPTPFKLFYSWSLGDSFDESIEEKIEVGSANDDDCDSRIKLLQEVDRLDTFESFDLFEKARAKWDIDGDENSKFFHGLIKQKRRAQMIHGIMKEGVWISDPYLIKEEFLNFYKEKFKEYDSNVDFPSLSNCFGLCALDRDSLETRVSLEEVKNAIWDYGSSKAPGPDRLYRLEREKDCLIIDCIDHGQWRWNWSRPVLGARNSADLLDMLFEISSAEINKVEDSCVWSLGTDGTFL
ncbi:RNA-directed DNA polymerase, eukaryota, reverse transcriptase zinc-binding domain protein [Tanacetum coccineum]